MFKEFNFVFTKRQIQQQAVEPRICQSSSKDYIICKESDPLRKGWKNARFVSILSAGIYF